MLDAMTLISGSFNEELIDAVQENKGFRIVGDNVNFHVGVSQKRAHVGKKDHMEHWFASAAIIQNFKYTAPCGNDPHQDPRELPNSVFIMNENEMKEMQQELSFQAARILCEFFPWLKFAKDPMKKPLKEVPEGMKSANKTIPLPIQNKNEQKYADVIDILDDYQELVEETFKKCDKACPTVHIGGDQLTRERFTGAKRLRACSLTGTERYENLYPVTFELFHLQMSLLTLLFQILYSADHTDCFTLYSQKVRLLRKDADGNDVKNHYDSCRELAISFIKAYTVEAACNFFGLPDLTTVPENIPDYENMTSDEVQEWLIEQVSPIISKVTADTRECLNGSYMQPNITDSVNDYANLVVEIGLAFLSLCDIIKYPNRERLLSLMKYLLLLFKGHNTKSKYALEILRFLTQQIALLSEKSAVETCYGLFVNTGKTIIPADLAMEHLVRLTKGHLRAMCSNVTEQSLVKRSSAFYGMDEISKDFDCQTDVVIRAQKYKRLSSTEDELQIIKDINSVHSFIKIPGRGSHLKRKLRHPLTKLNFSDLELWIEKHKTLLFYEL